MLHMQTLNLTVSFDRGRVMRVAHQASTSERREGQHTTGDLLARTDNNCDAACSGRSAGTRRR